MISLLETHRCLYNSALAQRKNCYEAEQKTVTYGEQSARLKVARKADDALALSNFSSCQRTLKRLDRAFQAFFRRVKSGEKAGYPRFRGFGRFDSVDFTIGDGAKLMKGGKARFQNVGDVKLKLHRAVEGTIKTATLQRHAGKWHVIFVADVGEATAEPSTNPAIGIDLGLKSLVQVILVNPKNTTQACSRCGCLPTTPISLSVRVYVCEHCQFSLDRDWNAAINIKNKAGIQPLQVNVGDCVMRSARSLPL